MRECWVKHIKLNQEFPPDELVVEFTPTGKVVMAMFKDNHYEGEMVFFGETGEIIELDCEVEENE